MASVSGKCLCGTVRFEVTLPINWVAHCHCTMCRRAHGAAYVTWVSVPTDQFRVTAGEEHLRRYPSSAEAERAFCDVCGSTLLFLSNGRWKGEVHVVRANIDDDFDHGPGGHAFFEDHATWLPRQLLPED